jgi:SOS response regulatory protein OraA/RecX
MKKKTAAILAAAAVAVAGLAAAGAAAARSGAQDALFGGKRLSRALEKAGVESSRVEAILAQAREYRPEVLATWRQSKTALQGLASLSPSQGAEVAARVDELFGIAEGARAKLQQAVEQLASNLGAREKAALVLNLADRRARFANHECGEHAPLFMERLEERGILDAAELAAIQSQIDQTLPEICALREELKSGVGKLRAAVASRGTSDARIEQILAELKQNRHAAAALRTAAARNVVEKLEPRTLIDLAGKGVRLQRAAEVLAGF